MKNTILKAAAVTAILLFAGAKPAEASSITVAGSTVGCFGTGCSTFELTPYSGLPYDLTFFGTGFSVVTDLSGSGTFTLGSFGRGNTNVSSSLPAESFSLAVTFTVPLGIGGSPTTFTAVIKGTNTGGGGAENVNFDNTYQTFTYSNAAGSGSFQFAVLNDPQVNKNTMPLNGTPVVLVGSILNATYTPTVTNLPPVETVPEPASLLLLGTGLTALAMRIRRARK